MLARRGWIFKYRGFNALVFRREGLGSMRVLNRGDLVTVKVVGVCEKSKSVCELERDRFSGHGWDVVASY